MIDKRFRETVERCALEVDTMAVWRSLSVEDKQKALRLLLGKNWRRLYKDVIDEYEHFIDRS